MNIINNINARENFNNAQMALIRANQNVPGFDVSAYKLTQGYLRLEQQLVTNSARYAFPVLNTQQPLTNNEQRLNLQDSFIISEVAIFLAKKASATDTAFAPQSFPDPLIFTTSAAQALKVYNGNLSIMVNNNVLLPGWDVQRHYLAPQTQTKALPVTDSATVNQRDGSTDGFYPMEPNIILVGSKNNEIVLNLKEALTTVGTFEYIQLVFRGILAQNSTNVS